ncbi:helix-turn-helix domain-containing protein [Denitrobaculum tricleocarpae]
MTPDQFKRWRKHQSFTQKQAAEALGISFASVRLYEAGERPDSPKPVEVPKHIELACAAVALGISSYDGPQG